jgi:hypothetical protein
MRTARHVTSVLASSIGRMITLGAATYEPRSWKDKGHRLKTGPGGAPIRWFLARTRQLTARR